MRSYLLIIAIFSSFSFAQTSLKSKEKLHSIEIFEKIIKEFNIDSKKKYMEVYEDSKELGLPPLSQLSQIYPEWEGWGEPSPQKKSSSDWVKKELRKIQEDLNDSEEFGGNEEFEEEFEEKNIPTKKELEEKNIPTKEEEKIVQEEKNIPTKEEEKIVQEKNLVPYEELKKIARDQGIKLAKDYHLFRTENKGVINGRRIPSEPHRYYGDEWEGWGEFLGKKPPLPFVPYEELKKFIKDQGIKTSTDYRLQRKKHKGVLNGWSLPSNPNKYYEKEWVSWEEFFGKPPIASYEELKKFVKDQGVKTSRGYQLLRRKKGVINGRRIPSNPYISYDEWEGWNEFLGKKSSPPFASYEELKKIARDQGIKSAKDYHLFRTENKGVFNGWRMPSEPHKKYKEWTNWNKFLEKRSMASYEELKEMVRSQGITSSGKYDSWRKKNKGVLNGWNLPSNPNTYYEEEWTSWGEFLGKKPIAPYEELKKFVRDQGVKTSRGYLFLREKNKGVINGWRMPSEPKTHYGEWKNWNEFLGNHPLPLAPYEELKKILIDQGIKKSEEYFSWREKNGGVINGQRIPSEPHKKYKEWMSWGVFLGKKPSPPFAPYEVLEKMVRNQGIKSRMEYNNQRDKLGGIFNRWRIPSAPHKYYNEWEGWPQFFNKCETVFKEVGHR